jgi:hypothetical protein
MPWFGASIATDCYGIQKLEASAPTETPVP